MERLSVDRLRADEKLIDGVKRFPCLWEIHNKSFRDLAAKESAWKIVAQEVGYSDEDCLKRWKSLRDRFVREAKKVKENVMSDGGSGYVPPWSLFSSMTFLMDSIRHRKSSMLTLKRDASELALLPEDSTEIEASGDGEFLPVGSPGGSSIDLNASPASKRRKLSHLPVPLIVGSASAPIDPRLNKTNNDGVGGGGSGGIQTTNQISQAILKSLKALEETVQEQQRVIVDEDELFGKQVAMVMQRLNSRQKAVAKLRIQQVFLDIEFPPEKPDIS